MRLILALAVLAGAPLAAADSAAPPAPPPATQKLIDASTEVAQKAHDVYLQALHKEQDKLLASLQKELEKATKKGDLDTAVAIKAQIDDVNAGLLQRQAETTKDLLGNTTAPAATPGLPAGLSTDCGIAPDSTPVTAVPKDLEAALSRCSHIALPKGDHAHYTFTCISAGTVAVSTGQSMRNFAEVWQELQKDGFKRVDDPNAREIWWVLEAHSGQRFTAFDANLAVMPVTIYANRFIRAH